MSTDVSLEQVSLTVSPMLCAIAPNKTVVLPCIVSLRAAAVGLNNTNGL